VRLEINMNDEKLKRLQTSQFIALISDNNGTGIHKNGYNGIASLIPQSLGNNIFVPFYCGMNFECTWLSEFEQNYEQQFEPRNSPMHIIEANDKRVVLHQPATSFKGIEAFITFSVEEPCYIHQNVRIIFWKDFIEGRNFKSLWASYMHQPIDKHVYLQANKKSGDLSGWVGLTKANYYSKNYNIRELPEKEITAYQHIDSMDNSPKLMGKQTMIKGPLSFYYGLYYDYLFLEMFGDPARSRLAYSAVGGGKGNAAWDYELHQDDIVRGKTYEWNVCLVIKHYEGREDILKEVAMYQRSTKSSSGWKGRPRP
jgi:hypothetical protein